MAQLVEHHLAKVRVAGSNPVVRSERVSPSPDGEQCSPVEWPRGEATDCKSVYTGSNPVSTSAIGRHIPGQRLAEKPQVRGQKRRRESAERFCFARHGLEASCKDAD